MRSMAGFIALLGLALVSEAAAAKPNFLIIVADDATCRDFEIYGGQAKTPNLKRLAAEGMRMERCFQAAPMCSPTRQCLYTGLYPVKSGAYPNHSRAYPEVRSIAHYLQAAGYRTFLSGKAHIGPKVVYPFEYSPLAKGGDQLKFAAFQTVLKQSQASGQPFLFIACSNSPHVPYTQGDPSAYLPAALKLPPVYVDTPETRKEFSEYLAELTHFDQQVGGLVGLLDENGFRDSTMVIVLGEQGNSFPFAKWTCYDAGLQSACVVRWPGRIAPASVSDALIEYVDVVPTLLEAAGAAAPKNLDGRSFLPVLWGDAQKHKKYVFGLQTSRGINQGPDHFGIRSVRSADYLYIRNLTPESAFHNAFTAGKEWKSWERVGAGGDAQARQLIRKFLQRPAEELYDVRNDPWNQTNLIAEPRLQDVRKELRDQLDGWMRTQGDAGQGTEMRALERMHAPRWRPSPPPAAAAWFGGEGAKDPQ